MAQVGDRIPDVDVRVLNADGAPEVVKTGEVLGTGKVVLFAVPGAFTPGCSKVHLPGYVANADDLKADGNGDFAEAMDLVMDGTGIGLGKRSKRYAAVIEDGVITSLDVEEPGKMEVSTCEAVIQKV